MKPGVFQRLILVTAMVAIAVALGKDVLVFASDAPPQPKFNAHALHRLDFRIVGKRCPVCLHKIQGRLEKVNGVVKAEVMLKAPFAAVIIYDASTVKGSKLLDIAKGEASGISFQETKDVPIKKLPLVLVPIYSSEKLSSSDKSPN